MRTLLLCLLTVPAFAQTTITIPAQTVTVPTLSGPIGPQGPPGSAGPAPTSAQIAAAVAAYCAANGCGATTPAVLANVAAIEADGAAFSAGADTHGNAYSATALGSSLTFSGVTIPLLPAGAASGYSGVIVPIATSLPYLLILGTAVNGAQTNQGFVVNYADGSSQAVTQSLSDWHTSAGYAGESVIASTSYRNTASGGKDGGGPFIVYGYAIALEKAAVSLALPGNRNVVILGVAGSPTAPSTAPVVVPPPVVVAPGNCTQGTATWSTSNAYGSQIYGNYALNNNDWGGTPGQVMWASSAGCWGFTDTKTSQTASPTSAPQAFRGWTQNTGLLQQLEATVPNWASASGVNVQLSALTKAKVHWAFTPAPGGYVQPGGSSLRWDTLLETDYATNANCTHTSICAYPEYSQLTVYVAQVDQVYNGASFYAGAIASNHGFAKTIGGATYACVVDSNLGTFSQPGGHTIFCFYPPNSLAPAANNALMAWGTDDVVIDFAPLIAYFEQSNPVDDSGNPIKTGNGTVVTAALLPPTLYLNTIQADYEVNGLPYATTTAFCVAMQNEPDC